MAANDYVIDFSDGSKSTIVIAPKAYNDTLSIRLFGKGFENYGERIQENILRIMESFANPTSPTNPTEGQVWYNNTDKVLSVFNGSTWVPISKQVIVQVSQPAGVLTAGDLWFNPTTNVLSVWNGIQFKGFASIDDYNTHVTNTNLHITAPERIILDRLTGTTITTAQLQKIQTLTSNAQTQLDAKFNKSGGVLTDYGFVHADPILDNHFANKAYVDDQIYQLATSLNLGNVVYRDVQIHTTYTALGQSTFVLPIQSGEFNYADLSDVHVMVFVQGKKESPATYTFTDDSGSVMVDFGAYTFAADTEVTFFRTKKRPVGYSVANNGSLVNVYENETTINLTSSATTSTVIAKPVGSPSAAGSYRTMVWVDGVLQDPGTAWTETATDITLLHGAFPAYEYPTDLRVEIVIFEYDGPAYISIIEREAVVTASNTSIINYATPYDYNQNDPLNPANDAIMVFITGIFQGVDAYTQNNGTFIKLAEPLFAGTAVATYKFKIVNV